MSYLFLFEPRSVRQCFLSWRCFRVDFVALDSHRMADLKFRKIKFLQKEAFRQKKASDFLL